MVNNIFLFGVSILLIGGNPEPSKAEPKPEKSISRPFSSSSIWNRQIPSDAEYVDVQDAIWGDPAQAPTSIYPDLVAIYYVDPSQSLVNFRLNKGWNYPKRSRPRGATLFQRKLSPAAGTDLRQPNNGNANYVIIDRATGLADEGTGAWRDPGSDFLTYYDGSNLHNIDLINGDGLLGARGSRLPALGGALRVGELKSGIKHSMAVCLSSRRYSKKVHHVWPAATGDGFASNPIYGYLGGNPHYTMGTLLAIPRDFDVGSVKWKTPQGLVVAKAAQRYGWYIVDSSTGERGGNNIGIGIERQAATDDLGLTIDKTHNKKVDKTKIDILGFTADIQQILRLVVAVKNKK